MEFDRQGEIRPFESERKPKLEVLDALRGFCALIVFALHFSENYIPHFGIRLIPHGCLPVEYFFMLTGFTLIYAYDDKWARGMSVGAFLRRRFVRLHVLCVRQRLCRHEDSGMGVGKIRQEGEWKMTSGRLITLGGVASHPPDAGTEFVL